MRPRRLNRDSSANSKTLPQSGHFGRLKSSVARTRVDALWYADCTIIVDPSSMLVHRTQPINQSPGMLRVAYGAAATPW
jgi:hypothetical protein